MEDQDFCAAALAHDFADHARIRLVANLAFFAGNRDHRKLNLPVRAGSDLLHSNYIARRHPVLLPTGADNRVHTSASVKMSLKSSPAIGTEPKRTPALKGIADFLCLLCFPPRRFSSQSRRPQNGSASTVKLHHFIVRCGNRSNKMDFRAEFGGQRVKASTTKDTKDREGKPSHLRNSFV